jgi:hypothetical protein
MKSFLAAGILAVMLGALAAPVLAVSDVNVEITNQTQVGAWITVYNGYHSRGAIAGEFCVLPGHAVEKRFTEASTVVAEIRHGKSCAGPLNVARLTQDIDQPDFRKTITMTSGTKFRW